MHTGTSEMMDDLRNIVHAFGNDSKTDVLHYKYIITL